MKKLISYHRNKQRIVTLSEHKYRQLQANELRLAMYAAPLNPLDIHMLYQGLSYKSHDSRLNTLVADIDQNYWPVSQGKEQEPQAYGFEGVARVIEVGSDIDIALWLDRWVYVRDGTFSQERIARCEDVWLLPEGVDPLKYTSFLNPLTVLTMWHEFKMSGQRAFIHTAASSQLGQMLVRLAAEEGIDIIHVVRSEAAQQLLIEQGAMNVISSSADDFIEQLAELVARYNTTLAFDAVGAHMPGQLLQAMELGQRRIKPLLSPYGSGVHKTVYSYGNVDPHPLVLPRLDRSFEVKGWMFLAVMMNLPQSEREAMREKALAYAETIFATTYRQEISLHDLVDVAKISQLKELSSQGKLLIRFPRVA